jgi:hypothetical protein
VLPQFFLELYFTLNKLIYFFNLYQRKWSALFTEEQALAAHVVVDCEVVKSASCHDEKVPDGMVEEGPFY